MITQFMEFLTQSDAHEGDYEGDYEAVEMSSETAAEYKAYKWFMENSSAWVDATRGSSEGGRDLNAGLP